MKTAFSLVVVTAFLISACGADMETGPPGTSSPEASSEDEEMPSGDETAADDRSVLPSDPASVPVAILDVVLADAGNRTGSAVSAGDVVVAEARTWNDGSLGCPQPGFFYTQAVVDGYWVVVQAGDDQLDYRIRANGTFTLCEDAGS